MRSSSGSYFVALDHVRAVAALLVFEWHFIHGPNGYPVPFEGVPVWGPAVLFDEGHVGVALFMTLSGYLFAKLLDGRQIHFVGFLLNRALRLFPLLLVVFLLVGLRDVVHARSLQPLVGLLQVLRDGLIRPVWPNGGWSIAVELHFYLLLPVLLWILRRSWLGLLAVLLLAVGLRLALYLSHGSIQDLAYWTIVGRIDQFVAGMLGFALSRRFEGRHLVAAVTAGLFITFYWWFDRHGGFYALGGSYPSTSAVWVVMPTIEGAAFAVLIAWYERSFTRLTGRLSEFVARIGEYSYSIYLLHFFVVFAMARVIDKRVLPLDNIYVALLVGVLAFLAMVPVGYLSMRFVERPFLKRRFRYVVDGSGARGAQVASSAN